ncbi:hypothetical protein BDW22DRAFT_1056590 [Trametopsis cervina]|nr:hypothetical protein BDW22DRAFT_1056590 [Trametopsis cervina]
MSPSSLSSSAALLLALTTASTLAPAANGVPLFFGPGLEVPPNAVSALRSTSSFTPNAPPQPQSTNCIIGTIGAPANTRDLHVVRDSLDDSEALNLKALGKIGSKILDGVGLVSGLGSFFGQGSSTPSQPAPPPPPPAAAVTVTATADPTATDAPVSQRDYRELFARDESGMLQQRNVRSGLRVVRPFIGTVNSSPVIPSSSAGTITPSIFGLEQPLSSRELPELLLELAARAVPASDGTDDQSGASIFSSIFKGAAKLLGSVFDSSSSNQDNQQQRRDLDNFVQLLARASVDDESGASILSSILNGTTKLVGNVSHSSSPNNDKQKQRRDFDALMELIARADVDGSEAFSLSSIFSKVKNFITDPKTLDTVTTAANAAGKAAQFLKQQQQPQDPTAQTPQDPAAQTTQDPAAQTPPSKRSLNELD